MMAKPRLALILIPLIFLSSSLVPSYALYVLITVLYMHHNPPISDLSFRSCRSGYMLSLKLIDTVPMKTTQIHSSLQTLTHNLTPPLCKYYNSKYRISTICSLLVFNCQCCFLFREIFQSQTDMEKFNARILFRLEYRKLKAIG